MEIFGYLGWFNLPQYVLQFVNIPCEDEWQFVRNNRLVLIICLGVAAGLYLVGLIFGGLGLLKISKRAGIKYGWIGFLPFANTFLIGKLAGETKIMNMRVKRIGLYAMILEILFIGMCVLQLVVNYMPLQLEYVTPFPDEAGQILGYGIEPDLLPAGMKWMVTASTVLEYAGYVFELIVLFISCVLFFAFFRKYYVRSPFMMTFLCALLPARGFTLFAVRNNTPMDYNAYMQQKMQEAAARRQAYYGPQGGNAAPGGSGPMEDPFRDFSDAPSGGSPRGGAPEGGNPPEDGGNDSPFPDF